MSTAYDGDAEEAPSLVVAADAPEEKVQPAINKVAKKVPITIVTGITFGMINGEPRVSEICRLSRRWKDYALESYSKGGAWEEDRDHFKWRVDYLI